MKIKSLKVFCYGKSNRFENNPKPKPVIVVFRNSGSPKPINYKNQKLNTII